ncbi:MAG: hypothetical protein JNN17_04800 [Verrucomicrobiaceae bacterium]|nr:hypothetical protein [Verrucomicrobiaceae bacterium]
MTDAPAFFAGKSSESPDALSHRLGLLFGAELFELLQHFFSIDDFFGDSVLEVLDGFLSDRFQLGKNFPLLYFFPLILDGLKTLSDAFLDLIKLSLEFANFIRVRLKRFLDGGGGGLFGGDKGVFDGGHGEEWFVDTPPSSPNADGRDKRFYEHLTP